MKTRTYQIKEVAVIAGVSTRTLRHYDEIELLTPSHRSAAGYRLYTNTDLMRLQQIMIGRTLGFALEDIRKSLDDPKADRRALLLEQRTALAERVRATSDMISSIDAAIALLDSQPSAENGNMDMKQIFNGFDPAQYEAEAKQRWGETSSYQESSLRTSKYTQSDWQRIRNESDEIMRDAIALLQSKVSATSTEAADIAERYRLWVDRWFYPCDVVMQSHLAEMYEGDPRFAKYFNDLADGLAPFISAAVRANRERRALTQR